MRSQLRINPPNDWIQAHPRRPFLWIDPQMSSAYFELLVDLHRRYHVRATKVREGRNRNVFIMPGGYVVKLPRDGNGCCDNEWEGSVSNLSEDKNSPYEIQYARTRLVFFKDIPVLFMEEVRPLTSKAIVRKFGAEPDWVNSIDGGQVGINRRGELVAYDYGRY